MNNYTSTSWPELKFEDLKDTITTVQLWSQVIGKIRLKKAPVLNHSWHVTLYVSALGLTTGSMPYDRGMFQIEFDFISHTLNISTSEGNLKKIELHNGRSVASFYKAVFNALLELNIPVEIYARPNEVVPAIPFKDDDGHCTYDKDQMHTFWQALIKVNEVFTKFRSEFTGKCSPVHLFWGAFDLAVTRFSGRPAPKHPGGAPNIPLAVMQEAYSHEVSSAGFWPGSGDYPHPVFYSYCYPTPASFGEQPVEPAAAFYSKEMGEFMLNYEDVRTAADPEATLLQFLRSTYDAAAITGNWDKEAFTFNAPK